MYINELKDAAFCDGLTTEEQKYINELKDAAFCDGLTAEEQIKLKL